MGRRNMAIVGTHREFHADMLDGRSGSDPSTVAGCASPEDAATSYFRDVFENSGGLIRAATVTVWPVGGEAARPTVYDMAAKIARCAEADAEPGEFDVTIEAVERV